MDNNNNHDILILGAGISGIGCAAYLRRQLPGKSWAILEMRDDLGGTWDLFKYPGIRSDSDCYTFAYDFKPWTSDKAIAPASDIKAYLADTAREYGIESRIRYGRKVRRADWDSAQAMWTLTVDNLKTGEQETHRCRWLFSGTGYYDYDNGFRPDFAGEETFQGRIVHPQHWPEDLDYAGKRIAVIGSGATAVTLLPALAATAAHVTQIQRTPSYIAPAPGTDPLLKPLRLLFRDDLKVHRIIRRKNVWIQILIYRFAMRFPKAARGLIRWSNRRSLPEGYPLDEHFNPPYNPWEQRLCAAPDGDYFKPLRSGKASVVTGRIERFTPTGVLMASGEQVEADIIVTATGLNLQLFGGIECFLDGERVDWSKRLVFKGMMLDGVPNFSFAIGYTNSSWTLKVGLLCQYYCRLLAEMDRQGKAVFVPERPARPMALRPLLDFGAGYVKRSIDTLPRQGDGFPWQMTFSFIEDEKMLKRGQVLEAELKLFPAPAPQAADAQRRAV